MTMSNECQDNTLILIDANAIDYAIEGMGGYTGARLMAFIEWTMDLDTMGASIEDGRNAIASLAL